MASLAGFSRLLQNGTIDIECGSTTHYSTRAKPVQFSTNYFYNGTKFLVKAGTPVTSLDDLKGKTVVSTTGTANFQILRNLNEEKKLGIDLLGAKDHADSALMVESGRAVAVGMDDFLQIASAGLPEVIFPLHIPAFGRSMQVSEEGQITIPKHIRVAVGVASGSEVSFSLEGSKIVITPVATGVKDDRR